MCSFNDEQHGGKRLCSIPSVLQNTCNDLGCNFRRSLADVIIKRFFWMVYDTCKLWTIKFPRYDVKMHPRPCVRWLPQPGGIAIQQPYTRKCFNVLYHMTSRLGVK